jgi:CRISPR-associated protein Cmr6
VIIKGLKEVATQLGIMPDESDSDSSIIRECQANPQDIPMMYRAQVDGRCCLQYAGSNLHRSQWVQEWVRPKPNLEPCYQYNESEGLDGTIYRVKVAFPFRLFSNCGQDSIARPVLGKYGIPFIPGSSVKGVFVRLCISGQVDQTVKDRVRKYCGDENNPGILRFHGAYPIGDWAKRIVDIAYPQQNRQVGTPQIGGETPKALISLYQPDMMFEFSSDPLTSEQLKQVGVTLCDALRQGLGGKTSTGYGLPYLPRNYYDISVYIKQGQGVTPKLLNGEPEFRSNLFKATLRGHATRLLAGACSGDVKRKVDELFGSTNNPGLLEIYWNDKTLDDWKKSNMYKDFFQVKGDLNIYLDPKGYPKSMDEAKRATAKAKDTEFIKLVLQFAYTMGGFGKSWRRVCHEKFYKATHNTNYKKFIGCHWEADEDWINTIKTTEDLKTFLEEVEKICKIYYKQPNLSQGLICREAWNKSRVCVYSQVVEQSQIIELFHTDPYAITLAVGGKERRNSQPTAVSSVWHRMLPLPNNQYLEIVTIFHGDRTPWERNNTDQLKPFIQTIKSVLKITTPTWGNEPNL